ncbi:MAG: low molecular weight phosphotyrosine protein phosphatase [Clostridia bacterium]|nr:low molecular weight phosphotyrosine protein phosphatase [Clostridia bacterium]
MTKVMFVCHGNICRSPMAEFLFKDLVKKEGLENKFYITSSATSLEEIGNSIHYGTKEILNRYKIKFDDHRAIQLTKSDYDKYNYIIAMDSNNMRNIFRIIGTDPENKVYKLLDFSDGGDVKDPWYTGNFDETYEDITKGLKAFLKKINN